MMGSQARVERAETAILPQRVVLCGARQNTGAPGVLQRNIEMR